MKTTVEIPDELFREAKVHAAERGISMKQFFAQAVAQQVRLSQAEGASTDPPWMKAFGGLRDLHEENQRIDKLIAEEFGRIDEEEWR